MERVFADTNVLFPFSIMDLLLGMAEDGVHEFVWSNDLLDEWERVIVENSERSAESECRRLLHAFVPSSACPDC